MTNDWHKYQTAMARADAAIDHFHALLIEKRYLDADIYLDEIRPAVTAYYGESTFKTLQDEMDDALVLPF